MHRRKSPVTPGFVVTFSQTEDLLEQQEERRTDSECLPVEGP